MLKKSFVTGCFVWLKKSFEKFQIINNFHVLTGH